MIHGNAETCSASNGQKGPANEQEFIIRINTNNSFLVVCFYSSQSDVTPTLGTS